MSGELAWVAGRSIEPGDVLESECPFTERVIQRTVEEVVATRDVVELRIEGGGLVITGADTYRWVRR